MIKRPILTLGLLMSATLPLGCGNGAATNVPEATSAITPASGVATNPPLDASAYRSNHRWWYGPTPSPRYTPRPVPRYSPTPPPADVATPVPVATPQPPAPVAAQPPAPLPTVLPTPVALPTAMPRPVATPTPVPVATPTAAPSGAPASVSAQAQAVLDLTNAQRSAAGVAPLALNSPLLGIAQARAQDMVDRNYFAHVDPDGHDVFWHMQQAGISFTAAGENIAMGQRTPQEVVTAWMSDAGHRDNLLNPAFGKLGVGIAANSAGTLYWVQDFTN